MKRAPDEAKKTAGLDVRDTCGMGGTATQQMIAAIANQVIMMLTMMTKMAMRIYI